MGVPENIDALMVEYDIPASSIARAAGVTEAAVSDWRNKGVIPRKKNLDKLCKHFGLSPDDILSDASGFAAKAHGNVGKGFCEVPLLGRISAGEPIPMDDYSDKREAPANFKMEDDKVFLLRVEGDSVNKVIPDGSFALISPKFREPNEHDLFAVCVNGYDATVKHVKKLANGFMLIPDSHDPTYRPKVFDYNDETTDEVTIIGKVVWWCAEY